MPDNSWVDTLPLAYPLPRVYIDWESTLTGETNPGPAQPPPRDPPPSPDQRLEMSKAKIALFGVLGAAVITGVFGLVQASIGPDGGSGGGKGGGSSRVPSTSSPESSPTSPSSAKTGPATEPKPVEYKGVDIPYGYALRFADEPVKPFEPEVGVNYEDLGWDSDGFYSSGTLVLLEESQEGSLSTCKGNTRYTDHVPQERVLKGSQVCIITEAGHVGLVTMRDTSPKDSPSEYVTVDLSVWHNAVKPEDEG